MSAAASWNRGQRSWTKRDMKFASTADEQSLQRQATDLVTAYLNVCAEG